MEARRARPTFSFKTPPHLLIVEARFYTDIADMQLRGVQEALEAVQATHEVLTVPGSLEIPAAISFTLKTPGSPRPPIDGYVALGCVIKGGTMHDEIVGLESARGLQQLAVQHALAIGNGILTCNTLDQALERADPARLNRGREAAEAALRMIEIKRQFGAAVQK